MEIEKIVAEYERPQKILDQVRARIVATEVPVEPAPAGAGYFNFTASHDGVGLRPLEGLVEERRITALADEIRRRGGLVSERANADGTTSPYELNVAYVDAVTAPDDRGGAQARAARVARLQGHQPAGDQALALGRHAVYVFLLGRDRRRPIPKDRLWRQRRRRARPTDRRDPLSGPRPPGADQLSRVCLSQGDGVPGVGITLQLVELTALGDEG